MPPSAIRTTPRFENVQLEAGVRGSASKDAATRSVLEDHGYSVVAIRYDRPFGDHVAAYNDVFGAMHAGWESVWDGCGSRFGPAGRWPCRWTSTGKTGWKEWETCGTVWLSQTGAKVHAHIGPAFRGLLPPGDQRVFPRKYRASVGFQHPQRFYDHYGDSIGKKYS